jgi:hypothetical protein
MLGLDPVGIRGIQVMDPLGYVRFGSSETQVIMAAHQAIGVADHGVFIEGLLELLEENVAVSVLEKDRAFAVSAGTDVVNGIRIGYSEGSSHVSCASYEGTCFGRVNSQEGGSGLNI